MAEKDKAQKRTKTNGDAHAVGRRKTSKCTIHLMRGEGENMVNGKKLEEYFPLAVYKALILSPFISTNTLQDYHFTSRISGGGIAGQADALRLAIARSLSNANAEYHQILSSAGLLTRDPRAKERKKIFFVRARKKPQYSKR